MNVEFVLIICFFNSIFVCIITVKYDIKQIFRCKNTTQFFSLDLSLFNTLTSQIESEHGNQLKRIAIDLDQLGEIFRELQRADALATQAGDGELKTRETITNYLHMVFMFLYFVL